MLARGELRMVGATTLDEYREHIEKDPALERRFQQVFVGEPSVEDTIGILRGLKERYEVHHGVRITDAAIVAAATLSDRYVTARFLPDKAIDLVDEAASRLRMEIDSRPVEVDEVERAVRRLEIEEMALSKEDDPSSVERLAALRADLADKRQQLDELTARWQQDKSAIVRIQQIKEELERARLEAERAERRRRQPAETVDYADAEGNVLSLRKSVSAGTIEKINERPQREATSQDDAWRRRSELLFERLAVSWEIAGLPLRDQKMLLGRYRLADEATQRWVRQAIGEHLSRHHPELAG
jgi:ATP-dependent Clp protease ATP-binding subunit ClpA